MRYGRTTVAAALALTTASVVLLATDSNPGAGWVSAAEARVGRPLTPMSYAGVARRTTRRAVAAGAVAGGGYYYGGGYPYGYARAGCSRVVGPYGRTVTRCY